MAPARKPSTECIVYDRNHIKMDVYVFRTYDANKEFFELLISVAASQQQTKLFRTSSRFINVEPLTTTTDKEQTKPNYAKWRQF